MKRGMEGRIWGSRAGLRPKIDEGGGGSLGTMMSEERVRKGGSGGRRRRRERESVGEVRHRIIGGIHSKQKLQDYLE